MCVLAVDLLLCCSYDLLCCCDLVVYIQLCLIFVEMSAVVDAPAAKSPTHENPLILGTYTPHLAQYIYIYIYP